MPKWLLLMGAIALVGCGGEAPVAPGGPPSDSPDPDDSEPPSEVFDYEGRLAWTTGSFDHGVYVWDLANRRMIFEQRYDTEHGSDVRYLLGDVVLSGDGSTLAYVLGEAHLDEPVNGVRIGSFDWTSRLVDLDTKWISAFPAKGTQAYCPSLSRDGTSMAVATAPSNHGPRQEWFSRIQVWETYSNHLVSIPDEENLATCPLMNGAGSSLFYRATSSQHFLRWDLETGSWGTPLSIRGNEDAFFPRAGHQSIGRMSLSADGRWLAFFGEVDRGQTGNGHVRPLLLDTVNGTIERVADHAHDLKISGDGTRLVWLTRSTEREWILSTRLRTESTVTEVARVSPHQPFAASHDGSLVAFVVRTPDSWEEKLIVAKPDGTDRQTVVSTENGLYLNSLSF